MTTEFDPQTITRIDVTDFMGIEGTVTLIPSGSLHVVAGPNGSGKSSFLHAVEECIDPEGIAGIANAIHNGKTEARVKITTTEAILERVWKEKGAGKLTAKALDGATIQGGAKAFVTKITGGLLFDPEDFTRLTEPEQRQQILSKVALPFNLDEINAKRKGFFDSRTDVSRERKRIEAQLAGYPAADPGVPATEVSASALVEQLDAIRSHNAEVDRKAAQFAAATDALAAATQRGQELAAALDQAKADYRAAAAAAAEAKAAAETAEPKSPDAITAQLADVDAVNARVREQAARAKVAADLAAQVAQEADLNAKLDAIDKTKAEGLAAATFPAGLSMVDDVIMYGEHAFKDVNKAVRDTVALDLATSGDPALKIVVMKSGNDLDDVSLARVQKLADERGYFVLMERITAAEGTVGFSIPTPEGVTA